MSMTLGEVKQIIKAEIPATKREIYRSVNRAIRRINGSFIGYLNTETGVVLTAKEESLTLTFTAASKTITRPTGSFVTSGFLTGQKVWFSGANITEAANLVEMTITNVAATTITVSETIIQEADITDCTAEGFTLTTDYSWDNIERELTLPDYVKEVKELYENSEKMVHKDLDYISDSQYDEELCYSMISDTIVQLPDWVLDAADDDIIVEMLRYVSLITTDTDVTVIDIHARMENLLISGVFFDLYSKPEYKDVDLATINITDFNNSVKNFNDEEQRRIPTKERDARYKY